MVINELESGLLIHVQEVGTYFKNMLEKLATKYSNICQCVRGMGLMLGLVVKDNPKLILERRVF